MRCRLGHLGLCFWGLAAAACSGADRPVCDDVYPGPVLVLSAIDAGTSVAVKGWVATWTCSPARGGMAAEQGGFASVDLSVSEPGTYSCILEVTLPGYEPSTSTFSAAYQGVCVVRQGATENRQIALNKSK